MQVPHAWWDQLLSQRCAPPKVHQHKHLSKRRAGLTSAQRSAAALPNHQSFVPTRLTPTRTPLQHLRAMKRRYVVLSGGVLAWYASEDATKPYNALPMADAVAQAREAPREPRERFAFTITLPPSARRPPLYFEASTERERDAWLAVLPSCS